MPIFTYLAKDLEGLDHKGSIETADSRSVATILSKKGLVVISIKQGGNDEEAFYAKFLNRVSFKNIVIITRQLATMVESGLVLSEALDILVEQQDNPKLKRVLDTLSRDVKSGLPLSSSLKKYPEVFPSVYSNLVAAGEQSGKLDLVLNQMAVNLEKDREFRSRIRGAMIYPIIVVLMMTGLATIMLTFVVPRLTSLYSQSSIDLPLPTKILIASSNILVNFWWTIIILLVVGVVAFKRWVKTSSGAYTFDSFLLKVPIVSRVIKGSALTNFTRTFGLLTTAGMPILDSLAVVSEVLNNLVYRRALQMSLQGVERGLPLSSQLEASGVFPKIVPQMFKVGEETGKVDQVSFKLAEYFETETDHLVKDMTVIIEPVVLVVLGVGVAFLVLSIILPIYKLTTNIH